MIEENNKDSISPFCTLTDDEDDDDKDDHSISALFDNVSNLTLGDQVDEHAHHEEGASMTTTSTTTTRHQRSRNLQRQSKKKNKSKKPNQHSLEHLRQRVSQLMSIFEENGWFIPLPNSSTSTHHRNQNYASNSDNDNKKGKVWSNRNYGADKKRQRKQNEKEMLETRIAQLETILKDEFGMDLLASKY